MTQIAYLGTGLLGSAFVEAAAKRGDQVAVWNRTTSKAKALESFGVRVASTPADAVRDAVRVHLVLKDDAAVDQVIAALRPGLKADAAIIDHTTTQPWLTARRAERLASDGVKYLHCPVFIGPPAAREGKGAILVSGPRRLFDEVEAALKRIAERVDYLGERPDLAAVLKLCGNALIIGTSALTADVLAVASGAGVSPSDALRVVDYFNPSATVTGRGKKMATGDYAATFELSMARKDVRLMMETSGSFPLATLPAIADRMDVLIAEGAGDDDVAAIGRDSVTPAARAGHSAR